MTNERFTHLSQQQIDADVEEYHRLLDENRKESDVQAFLTSHVYFFNGLARHHVPIYSKVKLGAEYELDFAFYEPSSFGTDWYWVEIESPSHRLFTKGGNPSAPLHHAMEQVRDWNRWLHENVPYARKLMPLVEYPLSFVFLGRRAELDNEAKKKLRKLNFDNRMTMRIHTLDYFADCAATAVGLGQAQLMAYSHAEMAKREPKESFDWLSDPDRVEYNKRNVKRLLGDRKTGGSEPFDAN